MIKIFSISKVFLTLSVLGVICFSSIFPSCSVSTASLSDVKMCTSISGNECGSDASTFHGDAQVIYCTATLKNAPEKTKVTFDWKHGGESLGKAEVETASGTVSSNFKPPATLEPGKYSVTVKIAIDNSTPITKEFTID